MYAYEMHGHEVHAHKMHAYKMHRHEMHAHEMHAHEMYESGIFDLSSPYAGPRSRWAECQNRPSHTRVRTIHIEPLVLHAAV